MTFSEIHEKGLDGFRADANETWDPLGEAWRKRK